MTFGHFRNQRLKNNIQQHARLGRSHSTVNKNSTAVAFNPSKVVLRDTQVEAKVGWSQVGCSRRPRKRKDDRILENHSVAYSQSSRRYGSTSDTQSTRVRRRGHHPNQPSDGFS